MKRNLFLLFLIVVIIYILPVQIDAKNGDLMTKNDFKIFAVMINKRFDLMMWIMGIGFSALAAFSLFLYKLTQNEMDKRFKVIDNRFEIIEKRIEELNKRLDMMDKRFNEVDKRFNEVDKRFEEVMSVLLLLVKAHEEEIGSEVIDVTLGKKTMTDISKEIKNDFKAKVEQKEKDKFKNYLQDPEIIAIIINEMKKHNIESVQKKIV